MIPNNAFSSDGPTDAEVKAAIIKALSEANHADTMETYKTMLDAQPDQLKSLVACHHGKDDFTKKVHELCGSIFATKQTDSARVYITVCGTLSPFWMDANFDPKKTVQEWIDRMDKADGVKTAANLVVAYKEDEYVRVMVYTSDATRMLRNSGKDGIFVSAATDELIRKGYAPVWGRRSMTLCQMLDACDDTTLGLLRNANGIGWRVQEGKVEAFRKKMGMRGPSTFYEVGPLPTFLLGDRIVAALSQWGWAGLTKVRCRLESKRQCTWTLRATGPPPASTVVLGGASTAHIRVVPRGEAWRRPTVRPSVPSKPPVSTPPGACAKPAPQKKAPAPQKTQNKRNDPTMAHSKTWAQVVAGGMATGKKEAKPVKHGKESEDVERKVEQMIATLGARLEEKASKRMAEMEKKMERERAAREDQSAKIDAIFAFIQQSAGAAQCPPAQAARTCEPDGVPTQRRREPSKRPSVASAWTNVGQSNQEAAPEVGRKRARPQVKKSVLGKQFAKAVEHKRARKRNGL